MSVAEKNDTEFNSFYVSSQWLPVSRGMLCHVLFSVAEDARKRGLCSHTLKSSCVFPFFKRFFFMCFSVCLYVSLCTTWVMGTKLWSSARTSALFSRAFSSPSWLTLKISAYPTNGTIWLQLKWSQTWWHTSTIPVLVCRGRGDSEFEDSLRNIVKPHLEKL